MRIIKSNHVTATEKKHLKAFLDSGLTQAKVNTKFYEVLSGSLRGDDWYYKVRISSPYTDDFGRRKYDKQTIELIK